MIKNEDNILIIFRNIYYITNNHQCNWARKIIYQNIGINFVEKNT